MDTSVVAKIKNRKILYCVLNWGLGHASRSIPLIKKLLLNNEVIVASDGEAGILLQKELPTLAYKMLPSYGIHYKYSSMHLNMLLQFPKIISAYSKEKRSVKSICEENDIDLIISDHRYGCRAEGVKSIFLGHQINIIDSAAATSINKQLISKFDECWIPDYVDQRLSGKLSDPAGLSKYSFVGPLSRMQNTEVAKQYDIAIVLSGPEPKRTTLEQKLLQQVKELDLKVCLVRGTLNAHGVKLKSGDVFDLLGSAELNEIMSSADMIVCRSGYSSLMDLEVLQKPALIIPTSGQREQEYLASHYSRKDHTVAQSADQLDLKAAYARLCS